MMSCFCAFDLGFLFDFEIANKSVAIYQLTIEFDLKPFSVQFGIRSLALEGVCISLSTSWIGILLMRLTTRTTDRATPLPGGDDESPHRLMLKMIVTKMIMKVTMILEVLQLMCRFSKVYVI